MVDNLFWIKIPSDALFHHKTMLSDITMTICERMIWPENQNISLVVRPPAPFPSRIAFSF
jgi:hypothetical protein